MLQLLWNIFKETGQVNTYMLYKALENENLTSDFISVSGGAQKTIIPDSYPEDNKR